MKRRPAVLLGLGLLGLPLAARGAGPEVWSALHDARLAESADRDPAAAIAIYETVLHHLPADDLLRGELLLQLARARFDEGDLEGSRAALIEASQDPQVGARARAWRVQVDAWERRVPRLPLVESFTRDVGPLVLGWSAAAYASLRAGGEGLAWTTVVRDNRDDYLLLALDEAAAPLRAVRVRVSSADLVAHLRLIVEDDGGLRWTTPVVAVEPGPPEELLVEVEDLLPAHTIGPERVDPARIRVVMLQDVTAFHSAARGPNRLVVSQLELR